MAALASLAARDQGKFWEMHDKIFDNQRKLQREDLEEYAKDIGLDLDKFRASLDNKTNEEEINQNQNQGRNVGVSGTPAFFVNGRFVSGARAYNTFKSLVEQEIAWAKENSRPEFKIGKNVSEVQPQKNKGPDPNKVYDVKVGDSPYKGVADAKVTIVEFFDFQ